MFETDKPLLITAFLFSLMLGEGFGLRDQRSAPCVSLFLIPVYKHSLPEMIIYVDFGIFLRYLDSSGLILAKLGCQADK